MRKAFKVAESEKPGATHLELPEDVMAAEVDAAPLPRRRPVEPEPGARELLKAADLIRNAINPVALAGNGVVRAGAAPALREFCRATGIPVAETFMGKGLLDYTGPARRWAPSGCRRATTRWPASRTPTWSSPIGYDLVEHSPEHWNPKRDKKIVVHRLRSRRRSTSSSRPRSSWSATSTTCSRGWPRSAATCRTPAARTRLRDVVLGRFEAAKDDDAFPMQPPRAL